MTIRVICKACQQVYRMEEEHAGRRFRCRKCEEMVTVPAGADDLLFDAPGVIAPPVRPASSVRKAAGKSSSGSGGFGPTTFLETFKKFGQTDGRASRMEYWNFVFFYALIYTVLRVAVNLLDDGNKKTINVFQIAILCFHFVLLLAILAPSIAVSVRRLHDTDRSGWWFLINFVPVLGGLIFLLFMVGPGTPGRNQYGPRPR